MGETSCFICNGKGNFQKNMQGTSLTLRVAFLCCGAVMLYEMLSDFIP